MSDDAISVRALADRRAIAAGSTTTLHAVIELSACAGAVDAARPCLAVAFALDVSPSMEGPPLEHVKLSMEKLVDLLDEGDRVSVVAFSGDASVVAPLKALDGEHKRAVKARVRRLGIGSATHIEAALAVAKETLPVRREHERQVILLLTDGEPNQGRVAPDDLAALARSYRPDVSVSTLGYGAHHDEDVLCAVADGGGGQYLFISDPAECELELARALGAQGEVVADGIELVLTPSDDVTIDEVMLHEKPRFSARGLVVPLPDMLESARRAVVVKLTVKAPREVGERRVLDVTLRHRRAGEAAVRELAAPVVVPVSSSAGDIDEAAWRLVLLARGDRVRAEARALADRGSFPGAAALLRAFLVEIEAAPGYVAADGSDLSEAYEQLLDEAVAYETQPSKESYRDFKRYQLGLTVASSGSHVSERNPVSAKAQALMAGVAGDVPEAYLVMAAGQERVRLGPDNVIGRTPDAHIMLASSGVSRRHTRVVGHGGRFYVQDLGSTNGTLVNGQRVKRAELKDGDEIAVGDVVMRFQAGAAS